MSEPFLEVRDLRVHFPTDDGVVKSVDGLSFAVTRGKTLGIVGESGSGKSVTSLSVMGLHKRGTAKITGEILLDGTDLVGATAEDAAAAWQADGDDLPGPAVGDAPLLHRRAPDHRGLPGAQQGPSEVARKHAIDMLDRVGIPQPDKRVDAYPHQFSGGMRQRAMIAMALSCDPELLIADEPTTALDVTVQAQILDLIRDLQSEFNSAVVIITHDLGVVAELADDILVMYAGRAAENGTAEDIFERPQHPYTWGLLGSMPRIDRERSERLLPIKGTPPSLINVPQGCAFNPRCAYAALTDGAATTERPSCSMSAVATRSRATCRPRSGSRSGPTRSSRSCEDPLTTIDPAPETPEIREGEELLKVTGLVKHFAIRRGLLQRQVGAVQAVDGLDFMVRKGETLSLVGESGCGKTTTGRLLTRLEEPTAGEIIFEGHDITHMSEGRCGRYGATCR